MRGISELKNIDIIEKKPYLTRSELSLLLEKRGKNLDKKILNLINNDYLIPLKKGLYTTQIYKLQAGGNFEEYLANIIYYPSCLSLEYVLAKEGLIPEGIYVYTSVTMKTTRFFENDFGKFNYRKIKNELFGGYDLYDFEGGLKIKKATKAKALFDYLYFMPFKNDLGNIDNLRINWDLLSEDDLRDFYSWVEISKSNKMERIYGFVKKSV